MQVLPPLQAALVDDDETVRDAAGTALNVLFQGGAGSLVDTIVPQMLEQLQRSETHQSALQGLRVILALRPHTLNTLLPKLLRVPLEARRVRSVGALAEVATVALAK